jgi:hypothetical protein
MPRNTLLTNWRERIFQEKGFDEAYERAPSSSPNYPVEDGIIWSSHVRIDIHYAFNAFN